MRDAQQQLTSLFRSAGQAHHQAFAATKGDDPDWPEWYAEYLNPSLTQLLGSVVSPKSLAANLRAVDEEMRARSPGSDWPQYYAEWFLARYSVSRA